MWYNNLIWVVLSNLKTNIMLIYFKLDLNLFWKPHNGDSDAIVLSLCWWHEQSDCLKNSSAGFPIIVPISLQKSWILECCTDLNYIVFFKTITNWWYRKYPYHQLNDDETEPSRPWVPCPRSHRLWNRPSWDLSQVYGTPKSISINFIPCLLDMSICKINTFKWDTYP